jgi:hypothetical protein
MAESVGLRGHLCSNAQPCAGDCSMLKSVGVVDRLDPCGWVSGR